MTDLLEPIANAQELIVNIHTTTDCQYTYITTGCHAQQNTVIAQDRVVIIG